MNFNKTKFVTCFDENYLAQGIALIESLNDNLSDYFLYIFCMDNLTYQILQDLNNNNFEPIKFSDFEDKDLLRLKNERKKNEFYWTITPKLPIFIFDKYLDVQEITYIDADLFFLKSPKKIFSKFLESKKDILITEHGYSPEYDISKTSGKFCVQFLIIKRSGVDIISKWSRQCEEWCFDRVEDGKFGDQKYLDEWIIDYPNRVYIIKDFDLFQGPWNANSTNPHKALAYHFHGLRSIDQNNLLMSKNYEIPYNTYEKIYSIYFFILKKILNKYRDNFKIAPLSVKGRLGLILDKFHEKITGNKKYIFEEKMNKNKIRNN